MLPRDNPLCEMILPFTVKAFYLKKYLRKETYAIPVK
jgi:hypothetical protein